MKSMVWAVFQYGVEGWTLKKQDRNRIEFLRCSAGERCSEFLGKNTVYQYINIRIDWSGKGVNGEGGSDETAYTVLRTRYQGKCRKFGTDSLVDGLRHQGRLKRQWMDDIEEWSGCSYIQLKEMSQDREQWRRKKIEWSSAVANRHRRWSTSE